MAYVIWRVVMKKYSRVRLGLHGSTVTPANRHAFSYDEASWKQCPDETSSKYKEEITRSSECRQSKTQRVKEYLKKCKNVLGNKTNSLELSNDSESSSTSWYIEKNEPCLNECEINELEDIYEDVQVSFGNSSESYCVANVIEVKSNDTRPNFNTEENSKLTVGEEDRSLREVRSTSPLLTELQELADGVHTTSKCEEKDSEEETVNVRGDVECLVDKYFGSLYKNYERSRKCLIRQARDLLVCEYHGCLHKFENEFCVQAQRLLEHLKNDHSTDTSSPAGWPLCLGQCGIVVHLGPLDSTILRNKDCYLCVRTRSAPGLEVTLIWRKNYQIYCHTIAEFSNPLQNLDDIMCSSIRSVSDLEISSYDDYDGADLPELLQNLLVSVEHAIKRIPLDDLTFPCPQCLQYMPLDRQEDELSLCACQCSCRLSDSLVLKKDSSIQTSPMFEFVGSIPHIDSDEEDDKESVKSGSINKKLEVVRPKKISELPEKLLMSGINLPGTVDIDGRPIILCFAECVARAALNKYEVAKLLLYYSSIPKLETSDKGFTIFLLAENEADYKVLELLDKSICLVNSIKVHRFLIWRPGIPYKYSKTLASRVQTVYVTEENSLLQYISKDQAPACCGGSSTHDQLEWVEFFKQAEPFLTDCKTAGRNLLSTMAQLRNEDMPHQITRRFLNHQCRQITRALEFENVQKLKREGNKTLTSLSERSQWLVSSMDVKRTAAFAYDSYNAVERVTKRLEQLKLERIERLKELARLKTLQDEADELVAWSRTVGDETLTNLSLLLRSAGDAESVKNVSTEFEKFFFNAWRQIEKANDLIEEHKNLKEPKGQNFKDATNNLQTHIKNFREKLEDTRERLENSSRCFLLLDSSVLESDSKESDEFIQLAKKSGNDKLTLILKSAKVLKDCTTNETQPPDKDLSDANKTLLYPSGLTATSTPVKAHNSQIRRRSVSSLAFIYHCNHHAAGELCNCYESDTENSVSYRLKKKYIQTLQNCNCSRDTLERKNSGTLRGIKEERESVENLLEKVESDDTDCRRCDSGLSTADNSVGDGSIYNKKKLTRSCSCQYYRENCTFCSTSSSSADSNQDHTDVQQDSIIEEGSDGYLKSGSDDFEEENYADDKRKVPPLTANNHLYCHDSTLDLPLDASYENVDPKIQKTLNYIIKEMIETERDYVKSLDYVIVNYIPELQREDIPQVLRGHRNTVFGNIEKIYEFHSHHFLRELELCETNPLQIGHIFLKYDKRFYLYALYNKNKPKSDSLMSEYGTIFFKTKQIQLGDKMDLASYLLKPVQRMGKYALLLQQMMKACSKSNFNSCERIVLDLEDLKQAEEMVRFQLRHGNDLLAMDSIRECDVNLKEQGRLLRQNEFLVWEGRSGKKSLRQVFLFEELILFSKARRFPDRKNLDLYIYKNSIKMTDIGLTAKIGDSPTKFEIWFRKRKPNDTFTLQSMSEDVKKAWTEELSQLLWRQAIKNRAIRMAEMSSMGIGNKPCLDIRPSTDQINDRSISFAQLSKTAPRFRNSIVGPVIESCRNLNRPHSVISMSSMSSSSTSSGCSGGVLMGPTNSTTLSFESTCESPKAYHRSATLNSQGSVESGIIADMSLGSDECSEQAQTGL